MSARKKRAALFFIKLAVALALFFLSSATSGATEKHPAVVLSKPMKALQIRPSLEFIEDDEEKLTIADIAKMPPGGGLFKNIGEYIFLIKPRGAAWLRFNVQNPTDTPITWIYEEVAAHFDFLELYELSPNGEYKLLKEGLNLPAFESITDWVNQIVRITTPPRTTTTYVMRYGMLRTPEINFLPSIRSEEEFAKYTTRSLIWLGIFFGVLGAMTMYNLFIFFTLRDKAYFWYVSFTFGMIIVWLSDTGLGGNYFWDGKKWDWPIISVGIAIAFLSSTQFSRHFFRTFDTSPKLDVFLIIFIILTVPSTVANGFYVTPTKTYWLMNSFMGMAVFFFIGLYYWRRGFTPARYYLVAWGAWMGGTIVYGASGQNLLPIEWAMHGRNIVRWGNMVDVILFSLALADRIQVLRKEKEAAQETIIAKDRELLVVAKAHAAELEQKVEERTAELKAANELKDRFVALVSHDLRAPIAAQKTMLTHLHEFLAGVGNLDHAFLAEKGGRSCQSMLTMIENILNLSRLRSGSVKLDKRHFDLRALCAEACEKTRQLAEDKKITATNNIPPGMTANVDVELMIEVLFNLLGNSVKFSLPNGKVEVSAVSNDAGVVITVKDDGIGIPPEIMAVLFTTGAASVRFGTADEKGSGYGLVMCKEIVEAHGGSIDARSEEGKGTTFFVRLPA